MNSKPSYHCPQIKLKKERLEGKLPEAPMKPESTEIAMITAKKAADWLRLRGATRVLLFGSLAEGRFSPEGSDIDIYFEGLPDTEALAATGRLLDIYGEQAIDPVPSQFCSPRLKADIQAEGVPV